MNLDIKYSFRVIWALWLRQLKRYFRSKSRMIGSLGQPILFLVALGLGFGPIYQRAGAGNYLEFLTPGIIAMTVLFTSIFSGIEIIWDRQFGFLKETLVAPVSRLEIMIGRTLGGATIAVFQALLIFFISLGIGFRPQSIPLLLPALICIAIVAILFTALGTAIASMLDDMQGFHIIMNFMVMPLFFLSGALFPIDGLPNTVKYITFANPLSYGVDLIRYLLTGISHFAPPLSWAILLACTAIFLALGAYLFSRIEI